MAFSQDYLEFILDQLSDFGDLSYKKMFGGVGFYKDGLMFGGIMGGSLHLKVNDETRAAYIERGMGSFFHSKKSKALPSYYQVPIEIIEDRDALRLWAEKAFAVAKVKK